MKRSYKGKAPQSFLDWQRGEIEPSFDKLRSPEKDDVRETLLQEQNHLCAYCGRTLRPNFSNCHIDHFWPREHFNDRSLDHNNFFLSCGPRSLPYVDTQSWPFTCGDAKGNWFDEQNYVMPSNSECETKFSYNGDGEIRPNDPNDTAAQNMITILKLDDEGLTFDRKKVVQNIEQSILQSGIQDHDIVEQIKSWWEPDDNGKMSGFAQVARRYFDEELEESLIAQRRAQENQND